MLAAAALPGAAGAGAAPHLVDLEIQSRSLAFNGESFGAAGQYERIVGVAHMRIDPLAPANRGIVDLGKAPRNAQGLVDYDTDVVILRPKDGKAAGRVLLFDVVNRGIKTVGTLNGGGLGVSLGTGPADPVARGDALLMRRGITVLWAGWQGDVNGGGLVGARFPVATDRGKPITGRIAAETIFENLTANRIALAYPAASLDQSAARLTVRALTGSPERGIPASQWHFESDRGVVVSRPADMDAGAIYRFEYVARDPRVMGLGFAVVRDLVAFVRHGTAAEGNPLADIAAAPCPKNAKGACANPAGGIFASAVTMGLSQSGRYLRDFLWQGFNADLAGRKVFDGVFTAIPGARRTYTNFRFAEPGRFSRQHEDHDVPGFGFPFTYATLRDPVTGRADGILRACTATGTCPDVIHMDTSAEFWQAGASLVGTGGAGHDIAFPPNVRAFMLAGGSHAPNFRLPGCRYPANPFNYGPYFRSLFSALVDWTLDRKAPPQSRWPRMSRGELVPLDQLRGPAVAAAGLVWPKVVNAPIAPAGSRGWSILVPAIDADGNDVAGIRAPQIAAPSGTYLGWNLRKTGYGEGDLCMLAGTYVPFAANAAARGGDARLSLAERYPAPDVQARMAQAAVDALVKDGLLLPGDR